MSAFAELMKTGFSIFQLRRFRNLPGQDRQLGVGLRRPGGRVLQTGHPCALHRHCRRHHIRHQIFKGWLSFC